MKKITLLGLVFATSFTFAQTQAETDELNAIRANTTGVGSDPSDVSDITSTIDGGGNLTEIGMSVRADNAGFALGYYLYNAPDVTTDFSVFTNLEKLSLNRFGAKNINIQSTAFQRLEAFKSKTIESVTFTEENGVVAPNLGKIDLGQGGPVKTLNFDKRIGDAPNLYLAKFSQTKLPISELAKVFDSDGLLNDIGSSSDYAFDNGTDIDAFDDADLTFEINDPIDLSAQFVLLGQETESGTVLTWYKSNGDPAVLNVDYTEDAQTAGLYTFLVAGDYYYKAYNTNFKGMRKGTQYLVDEPSAPNYSEAQANSLNEPGREQQSVTITINGSASVNEVIAKELLSITANGIVTKKAGDLKVINLSGQVVISKTTTANENIEINKKGIFIVQFSSEGKAAAVKVIF